MNCFVLVIIFSLCMGFEVLGQRAECDKTPRGYHSTCRWDTTQYYNTRVVAQPEGVDSCGYMSAAALLKTELSIEENMEFKISYQSVLDCLQMRGDLDKPMLQLLWYLNTAQQRNKGFCMSNADGTIHCTYGREYDGQPNDCLKYDGSVKRPITVKRTQRLSIDALKTKLLTKPLIAVIDATVEFRNHDKLDGGLDDAKNVFYPKRRHSFKGRHALVLLGWGRTATEDHVLVKNSWGMSWGIAGHSWICVDQKDYLKILNEVYEISFNSLITNM